MRTRSPLAHSAASARSRVREENAPWNRRNASASSVVMRARVATSSRSVDTSASAPPLPRWLGADHVADSSLTVFPSVGRERGRLRCDAAGPVPFTITYGQSQTSGISIRAAVEVGVVRLVLRNLEVDIGAIRRTVDVNADGEDGIGASAVLTNQPSHIAETMTRQIHPESPLAEEKILLGRRRARIGERSQAGHGGTQRIQRGQPRAASPLLVLGDDELRFSTRGKRNRTRLCLV